MRGERHPLGTVVILFRGKPIIGLVGGIGSGKSHVAGLFAQLGCLVIDSDAQVREAYELPEVRATLRAWWGDAVDVNGQVNRPEIARRVFSDEGERKRLEGLLHPLVARLRDALMERHAADPAVLAYVWDTPLLVETGLYRECDVVVFVDTPAEERLERVMRDRGWSRQQWEEREKTQAALDIKRKVAKYMVRNTARADDVRSQVRSVLSQILEMRESA